VNFSIVAFIAAFGAGAFGAAIGALPAFIIFGILVLAGVATNLGGGPDFLGPVSFGLFGPHIAGWASGVAAAAYAANKGKLATGRDVASPLMGLASPDVLLVGALFGGIGYVINWLFNLVGFAWTDTIALTVVVSAIIARVAFGKTGIFGKPPQGTSRMAMPAEANKWLPWQSSAGQIALIGLGGGLMAGYFAINVPNVGHVIGFAISAISLVMLQFNLKVPVSHHITLTAGVAAMASGSLLWGAAFGLLAAFVGEYMSRLFLVYGDTHIDPPAVTIALLTSLSLLLAALGVYAFQLP
jgi:hypothetical protein